MAPPGPISKQRRKVLTEEEYSATLASIVQRDYFPEIPELERQAAVLERRAQGDIAGAVAVRRAARRLQQHEDTLTALEEEDEHDLNAQQVRRRARPLHQETITGFHARVTNEDDEEFYSNQKREIQENRDRLEKLFRPTESNNSLPLLTNNLASDQYQAEPNRIAAIEWHKPSVRNGLFFVPTPQREKAIEGESEPQSIKLIANGHNGSASTSQQLALMPPPAKINVKESTPKHQLVEFIPKHAFEKRIDPSQTRFPNKIIPLPVRQGLVTASELESETDGSITDASTDLDAPLHPVEDERRKRQLARNRQSYVAMTPLIIPGVTGNESPIMTWGTVDSTPLIMSGQESQDHTNQESSYSLAAENERERAARKAEKELARRAKRAKGPSTSKSSRSTSKGNKSPITASLTPAALSLWNKTKGTLATPARSADAFSSSLRSSYTPKRPSSSIASRASTGSCTHGTSSRVGPRDTAFNSTPLASRKTL